MSTPHEVIVTGAGQLLDAAAFVDVVFTALSFQRSFQIEKQEA